MQNEAPIEKYRPEMAIGPCIIRYIIISIIIICKSRIINRNKIKKMMKPNRII